MGAVGQFIGGLAGDDEKKKRQPGPQTRPQLPASEADKEKPPTLAPVIEEVQNLAEDIYKPIGDYIVDPSVAVLEDTDDIMYAISGAGPDVPRASNMSKGADAAAAGSKGAGGVIPNLNTTPLRENDSARKRSVSSQTKSGGRNTILTGGLGGGGSSNKIGKTLLGL